MYLKVRDEIMSERLKIKGILSELQETKKLDELKALQKALANTGSLSHTHAHIARTHNTHSHTLEQMLSGENDMVQIDDVELEQKEHNSDTEAILSHLEEVVSEKDSRTEHLLVQFLQQMVGFSFSLAILANN